MKHELITFKSGPEYPVESRLSVALRKAKADGRKVLDFWRSDGVWTMKLMVPRDS